jgi:menaquinone-dependent protoporphyrinogen oxidase
MQLALPREARPTSEHAILAAAPNERKGCDSYRCAAPATSRRHSNGLPVGFGTWLASLHYEIPEVPMANILIAYATKEGQTRKIAQRIGDRLASQGHAVELVDTDSPTGTLDLERFQVAVVGGPIHARGYPRSIVRFALDHRRFLDRVPSAFFSVGLAIASRTSDGRSGTLEIVERFVQKTGWRPRRVELIAGALPYSKYNFLIRFLMRRISASEGGDTDTSRDYEYTDWSAVDAFARSLVADTTNASAERSHCVA